MVPFVNPTAKTSSVGLNLHERIHSSQSLESSLNEDLLSFNIYITRVNSKSPKIKWRGSPSIGLVLVVVDMDGLSSSDQRRRRELKRKLFLRLCFPTEWLNDGRRSGRLTSHLWFRFWILILFRSFVIVEIAESIARRSEIAQNIVIRRHGQIDSLFVIVMCSLS